MNKTQQKLKKMPVRWFSLNIFDLGQNLGRKNKFKISARYGEKAIKFRHNFLCVSLSKELTKECCVFTRLPVYQGL